jgi:subtilisin family serine protease
MAQLQGFAVRHVYGTAVKGFAATIPVARLAAVRNDPRVVLVEAEREYELVVQTLPTGINRVEADRNPNGSIDGSEGPAIDLDVVIFDSGIDQDHPDLNVAGGRNFANGPSNKWNDGHGHGTHVAGTVGARDNGIGAVGVAPGVRVWAARVCGNGGFCLTGDMVGGIDWAAEQKTSGAVDFAAANMSISTSDDANACTGSSGAVHEAICGLVESGVVFAMAAGNDDRLKTAYPEVLAVSALADFDGRGGGLGSPTCRSDVDETLANFSNYGPTVDIAAPGVCIFSTWKGGGYNTISGTSMASPHVAGAVALYLHANDMSPAQDGVDVGDIEAGIVGAALPQSDPCGYTNEHAAQGSGEPLLFANATAFGGDGTCDNGGGAPPPPPANDPPNASFTHDCTDLNCSFDGSGSTDDGTIAGYDWNFGDGNAGSGATVSHSYAPAGIYTVTLTVTDDDGAADTDQQDVTVSESTPPPAGGGMHVGDLDGTSTSQGRTWTAIVTIAIDDADHAAVANATVNGAWTGGAGGSGQCTTNDSGQCTVEIGNIRKRNGSATFTVGSVTHDTETYVDLGNHDPDGDSDGTAITIIKP